MSNIKRVLTLTQEIAADAADWTLSYYFSYVPSQAPADFETFCEKFEAGELPEAVLWEPFQNYAEAQVVEWMQQTMDSVYNLLITRATKDGAIA